jgi:ABC-2 type transport system permease protein
MKRLLWIARHEYLRHIRRKGFLMATFGMPLLLIAGFALIIALIGGRTSERAIGYVDQAGVLSQAAALPTTDSDGDLYVPLLPFGDEAAARAAFLAGQIDAYVVIGPDYRTTAVATVYARENLSTIGEATLRDAVRTGLVASQPPELAARAINPIDQLTRRTLDGGREADSDNFLVFLLPILVGLLFMISVFFSSGYLLMALIEEKENRTMEIVMTSIAPWQLVGGKTLGLGLLGLTQVLIWGSGVAVLLGIGAALVENLRAALPLDMLLVAVLFFIPGYLMYAGCMVGISAMVTSTQEGQQFSSILSLLAMSPFFANVLFITDPNGTVPLIMSFFPLSAPIAMLMRMPLGDVPLWQIATSLLIVAGAAALAIWGAAKIFRAGMLRYGKSIKLRDLFGVLRTGQAGAE